MSDAFEFPYLMTWTLGAPLVIAIISILLDGTMERDRPATRSRSRA